MLDQAGILPPATTRGARLAGTQCAPSEGLDPVRRPASSIQDPAKRGNGVQIGAGAIVQEGSVVEDGSIVAPGSVVSAGTLIKKGQFWAGNPATYVRDVDESESKLFEKNAAVTYETAREHIDEYTGEFGTAYRDL